MTREVTATGTRERLLRAAQELIEEGGYGAASVAAIAERAGVAPGRCTATSPPRRSCSSSCFGRCATARWGPCGRRPRRRRADATHVRRLEAVLATFAAAGAAQPRLAWALIAEPVDPLVDAERLAYRRATPR